MRLRRVVVTGLGALTPIGNNVSDFWNALINGVSGVGPITKFDASNFKTQFAFEVKNFNATDFFDKKDARKLDPNTQFGKVTAEEAFKDADLGNAKINLDRCGVIWGSGIGGLQTFEEEIVPYIMEGHGVPRFSPFFITKMIADTTAGHISMQYGFCGPNFATVSACASAANAIADAFNYIRLNKADLFICGGSEAVITRVGVGGFNALRALSCRNDDYQTASRPFDKDRDGFVLGEGAGSLVLEDMDHALRRGAKIYAEIVGSGLSADAYHITAPHPEGLGARKAMLSALADANLKPTDIQHINTHGTSTPPGDLVEARAIDDLLGDHRKNVYITSTKSMTGHLLGASGVVEAIATLLSVKNDIVPPIINHFTDDPEIAPLNFVYHQAKKATIDVALSNTFGFGGHNVSLAFKKFTL
ncbi:MAG: beta-ketoacyl-ACP synthase II [Bacteroidales bacterium]|nr:beta-ketoacyl-ACP synthase II [Bacteroidales bacterium]